MGITPTNQLTSIKEHLRNTNSYENKTVEQIRIEMAQSAALIPEIPGTIVESITIGHLKAEWISTPDATFINHQKRAILYFHGGGFVSGTCEVYRDLAARISRSSGVKVLVIEYRLAPEHTYPAANEDCIYAYCWLLKNGYSARHIILGGDSVGGSLALMTLLYLRDADEELPAGAFLLSPHTDLVHLDGESYISRAELDPTGSLQSNKRILDAYLGSWSREIPALLSPLRMTLKGLPSLFIQVGDHEVLRSDATRFADRARDEGVEISLEVWENMWSVFQMLAYMLPEAQQAIENLGQYVKRRLNHES